MVVRILPTDKQIEVWLSSPEVVEWVKDRVSRRCPPWRSSLTALISEAKANKNHDVIAIHSQCPSVKIGINAVTWTLWAVIKYEGNITLSPDCPYRLQDYCKTEELSFVDD